MARFASFCAALAVIFLALSLGAPVSAQVSLPPTPGLPTDNLPVVGGLAGAATDAAERTTGRAERLIGAQARAIRSLLRRNRSVLEADPAGAPIVKHEILALAPAPETLAALTRAGFAVARRDRLEGLGAEIIVLRAPDGMSTALARARIGAIDPEGTYDFNHLYLESGAVAPKRLQRGAARAPPRTSALRIGLIDGGVATHAVFARAPITQRVFAGSSITPSAHGTAVASLIAGESEDFVGAAPGAHLYVADVYGGAPEGGSTTAIARALSWLAEERVAVINVSLVGPRNRVLERLVGGLVARGFLIVAAVGNNGPAAPPLYPAAYDGVVGVTGLDARSRALVEAGRGPQVDFAALGITRAARGERGYETVRGTSFAAPVVAAMLAADHQEASAASAQRALARLEARARDLGAPGRDPVFGAGWVDAPAATAAR